ncbi:hypothetical protein [Spiroplasma gladiatoris]|uniref:hypothetical protein n=1 Tax=Spiroplasma gladiatoris TaxID=2143 RepID=UPI0010685E20|nr:hypothetical protein [Spiroplasma gladiatoris]
MKKLLSSFFILLLTTFSTSFVIACPVPALNLNDLEFKDLGVVKGVGSLPNEEYLVEKINEMNNLNIKANEIYIDKTQLTISYAKIIAKWNSLKFIGEASLNFTYVEKTVLSKVIKKKTLGEVENVSEDSILKAVNKVNSTNFTIEDVSVIPKKNNTGATLISKKQSNYVGDVDVSYYIKPEKEKWDLSTIRAEDKILRTEKNTYVEDVNIVAIEKIKEIWGITIEKNKDYTYDPDKNFKAPSKIADGKFEITSTSNSELLKANRSVTFIIPYKYKQEGENTLWKKY